MAAFVLRRDPNLALVGEATNGEMALSVVRQERPDVVVMDLSLPELNGLDGRHSGTVAGFDYSDANKNSGIVWGEAKFKEYIKDPRGVVPGTKMIFAGIKNDNEVNDLWAYVSQFDADGNVKKK